MKKTNNSIDVAPPVNTGLMNRQQAFTSVRLSKEEAQRKIEEEYERDHEMVTGTFMNIEHRSHGPTGGAGTLQFGFKKYKQDTYDFYEFIDGERYTIPYMVADHISKNCYNLKYQNLPGEMGQANVAQGSNPEGRMIFNKPQMAKKVHRFSFVPLDYSYANEFKPVDIAQVSLY